MKRLVLVAIAVSTLSFGQIGGQPASAATVSSICLAARTENQVGGIYTDTMVDARYEPGCRNNDVIPSSVSGSLLASNGIDTSQLNYFFDVNGNNSGLFDFQFDMVRNGVDLISSDITTSVFGQVSFFVDVATQFSITGALSMLGGGGVQLEAYLRDASPGIPGRDELYESYHRSLNTPNEMFTLGQSGGDDLSIQYNPFFDTSRFNLYDPTTLQAGRQYFLSFEASIWSYSAFPNPASANGNLTFSFAPAPVPLPASLPLFLVALGGLGWLGRKRIRSDEISDS